MVAAKKKSATSKTAREQDKLVESLRQFIRAKGPNYLTDPNVTSIGIGYRKKGGKQTKELTLQFTVGVKADGHELEALDTTPIPETIRVDGVDVPTDVL